MPVYRMGDEPVFPPGERAHSSGLLALGGRLEIDWLLAAYRGGIFPWYDAPPIAWCCPDPRLVLYPNEVHVSHSLRKRLRRGEFEIRLDTAFREVIHACAVTPRRGEHGTWINPYLEASYVKFHEAGYAHSIECWQEGALVGGLYGVSLGRVFFGESMFHRRTDASKAALAGLASECDRRGFEFIDCQIRTDHLVSMGAREIPRSEFLRRVRRLVDEAAPVGKWSERPS